MWGSQGSAVSVGNGTAVTVWKEGADICTCAQRGKPDTRDQLSDPAHKWHLHVQHHKNITLKSDITLKAAGNIWAENLFFMEKPLLFPGIWDYQISVWMTVSCLIAVSVCADVKMERVMHLYISSGFGFPTGNPFCPKAALKVRNQFHILRGMELKLNVLLPSSPLWNSHWVQQKAWHELLPGSHMEIMFLGAKIIPPLLTWEKCKSHTSFTEAIESAVNNTEVLNTSPTNLQQRKQATQKFNGFHLPVKFQRKLLLGEFGCALQH